MSASPRSSHRAPVYEDGDDQDAEQGQAAHQSQRLQDGEVGCGTEFELQPGGAPAGGGEGPTGRPVRDAAAPEWRRGRHLGCRLGPRSRSRIWGCREAGTPRASSVCALTPPRALGTSHCSSGRPRSVGWWAGGLGQPPPQPRSASGLSAAPPAQAGGGYRETPRLNESGETRKPLEGKNNVHVGEAYKEHSTQNRGHSRGTRHGEDWKRQCSPPTSAGPIRGPLPGSPSLSDRLGASAQRLLFLPDSGRRRCHLGPPPAVPAGVGPASPLGVPRARLSWGTLRAMPASRCHSGGSPGLSKHCGVATEQTGALAGCGGQLCLWGHSLTLKAPVSGSISQREKSVSRSPLLSIFRYPVTPGGAEVQRHPHTPHLHPLTVCALSP